MAKRPDWSRPLPQPLIIPDVMTLRTLADVRMLLRHLPKPYHGRAAWQHVAAVLAEAARGASETRDVSIALQLAFQMEGGNCRPG